jgi:hypothetical protein
MSEKYPKMGFLCFTNCTKAVNQLCTEPKKSPRRKGYLRAGDRCPDYQAPENKED